MELWVLHSQGTIVFCLHLRKTIRTVFPSCAPVCPSGSFLDVSRLLGLTLRHSAPVCCCHRGCLTRWRLALRRKPRVLLLLRLLSCPFESRCALCFLTACEECPFKRCGRMKFCFPRNFVFHTLCYLSVVSLTVVDHPIGIRLEALQIYYVLVLWVLPSRIGGERFARTSLKKTRCVVTYRAHARLFSSQVSCMASILLFLWPTSLRLGLPVETILDPCWRIVSEGLLGGMDTHG